MGTPIGVQQTLMRHSDIRTTLNIYSDVVTDEMAVVRCKVAELAFEKSEKRIAGLGKPLKEWLLR